MSVSDIYDYGDCIASGIRDYPGCVSGYITINNDYNKDDYYDYDFEVGEKVFFPIIDEYRFNANKNDIYEGEVTGFSLFLGKYTVKYNFLGEDCMIHLFEEQMFRTKEKALKIKGVRGRCRIFEIKKDYNFLSEVNSVINTG